MARWTRADLMSSQRPGVMKVLSRFDVAGIATPRWSGSSPEDLRVRNCSVAEYTGSAREYLEPSEDFRGACQPRRDREAPRLDPVTLGLRTIQSCQSGADRGPERA